VTDLRHQELGEAFGQTALLAGQDHLQHVSVQLLHHHEHPLRGLEHAVQVDDPRVLQVLVPTDEMSTYADDLTTLLLIFKYVPG